MKNCGLETGLQIIFRLYQLALYLFPRWQREKYALEMQAVFRLKSQDVARKGVGKFLAFTLREAVDLPKAIGVGYFETCKNMLRRSKMLFKYFPNTNDRTPWRITLLSLIPFLLTGPLLIIYSYHPWWDPQQSPWISTVFGCVVSLAILIGFVLGIMKKFPRWSYPYAIYVIVLLTFLVTYLFNRTPWDINHEAFILLLVITFFILATRLLPIFRPFNANIRQDWTLLSYTLYSCTLVCLTLNDHDITPSLNLMVLLPSLIGVLGALAYLRLTSAAWRVAVLFASMLFGVLLITIPIFSGMMGTWQSFLRFIGVLVAFWGVLAALLIAPILVNVFIRPRETP